MSLVNTETDHRETGQQTSTLPVWVRLTGPNSAEFFTGIKRGTLYNLCVPGKANKRKPPVVSKRVPIEINGKPSTKRATRLVNLRSLLEYIDSLPADTSDSEGEPAAA